MTLQPNTLHLGDCLSIMRDIEDHSIDMVMCDLPYGTSACRWDSIIPFEPLWAAYKRVCKPNAAIVLTASQPFTSALVMSNIKMFKYCWVWDKKVGRGHLVAKKRPMARHEDIAVFCAEPPVYNPIMVLRDKPVKGKEGKRTEIMGGQSVGYTKVYTHAYPQTILSIGSEGNVNKTHPTQKPLALMEYLIKTYTNEGALVLDNTCGSGTTCVAAKRLNRRFIGIEMDPTYYAIAVKRVDETVAGSALPVEPLSQPISLP